jgi:hypothetical protein
VKNYLTDILEIYRADKYHTQKSNHTEANYTNMLRNILNKLTNIPKTAASDFGVFFRRALDLTVDTSSVLWLRHILSISFYITVQRQETCRIYFSQSRQVIFLIRYG